MRRILWIVAVAVTVFALSLNAIAQPGGGQGGQRGQGGGGQGGGPGMGLGMGPGMGFGGGGMGMMMPGAGGMMQAFQNPEFANMLELTAAQRENLPGVVRTAFREEFQRAMEGAPPMQFGGPPDPAMMQRIDQAIDAVQTKIHAELTPTQRTKAGELLFQTQGGFESQMLDVRALGVLDLTDAQKEQIRKITEERNAENIRAMTALRESGADMRDPATWEGMRTDSDARTKKFADQIQALLTPEQKAKADQLTAGIPAVRERLGIPAPGQQQQGRGQQQGRQAPTYTPGAGSWRPGEGVPQQGGQPQQRGGFPRPANNSGG